MSARIAVLASGGGSNLQALLDHFGTLGADAPGEIVVVASDKADALALERARRHGVEAVALDQAQRTAGLLTILGERAVTHVVLAGYLRLVPSDVARSYHGRMLNVHPALLPAFGGKGMYGHRVHEAVVASGARVTGATVHFVDEHYDQGPIIAQWPVPVFAGDTASTVAIRVLEVEHQLFPPIVAAVASGRVSLDAEGRVTGTPLAIVYAHFAASDEAGAADAVAAWPAARA
jgi:formyltetrahydrofolate-dependent phosphoribosylglycinamide formyltransferase